MTSPISIASATRSASTAHRQTADVATERRAARFQVSVETLCYAGLLLAAILTRFWDLGSRALHHDESLHAYFSWIFAEGYGYRHDPLMHGPFLFHANALIYLLLGATDATSRLVPAFAGVIVVMLPWLLRDERFLGRWGALAASALILISPSILYYSRFLRHDIYCLLGTFALFIAIVRYVDCPQPRWAVLGGVSIGFLLCTKEVSFIVLFIFGAFLGAAAIYRVAPILFAPIAGALVGFGILDKVLKALGAPSLPGIPWSNPTNAQIQHFAVQLVTHPLVVGALGIALLGFVVSVWLLERRRDPDEGWLDGLLGDVPDGSVAAALRELLLERRGLLWGSVFAIAIFVLLYTTLFTNLEGLASGTFGALGYWLGQQNVQRGEEPWFYYLLLLPQYEFVAVVLFPVVLACFAWSVVRARRAGAALTRRMFFRGLLIAWALGMLAVLSWAGEKMPWLTIHIALPMTLLAASYIGDAIAWFELRGRARGAALLGGTVLGLLGAAYLVLAWASDGPYVNGALGPTRTLRPGALHEWWFTVYLPWILLLVAVVVGVWRLGARRSMLALLLAASLGLSLAELHAGWRMTYREGDVPKDMLIYVQTSPDVPKVTQELTQLSEQQTGGMGLEIWYDDIVQWPFNWYLHDFPNKRFFGNKLPTDQPITAPVVIIADDYVTPAVEAALHDYTYQEYPMRWWFPEEETYRRFAYAPDLNNQSRQNYQDARKPPFTLAETAMSALRSIWSLHQPQEQAKMFRLVAFRETPVGLGSVRFRVYVRNDLMPSFNSIRYGSDS